MTNLSKRKLAVLPLSSTLTFLIFISVPVSNQLIISKLSNGFPAEIPAVGDTGSLKVTESV